MLTLLNVEIDGRRNLDVRLNHGRIVEIGAGLRPGGETLDGRGGALLPGLLDHHVHLLATAARAETVSLDGARGPADAADRVVSAAAARPPGTWIRCAGYHERHCGDLSRERLDAIAPGHPVRVEHQSGALWVLNSQALRLVATDDAPACVERHDATGEATGNIWRGEDWLARRVPRSAPRLAPLAQTLAEFGVTGVVDASPTTDVAAAALIAQARRQGELPQRVELMSAGPLSAPEDGAFSVGAVKFLLDEPNLPDFEHLTHDVQAAHRMGRAAAFHCVTHAELAMALAVLDAAGGRLGDRIEHGGLIAAEAIAELSSRRLRVVTQPIFIQERGDRYLADVAGSDQPDLYRCATLLAGGVAVAGSSDAPYGSLDPWAAMRCAVERRTAADASLGAQERIDPAAALQLYLRPLHDAGGAPRRVQVGETADLCLLRSPLDEALFDLDRTGVAATLVGGEIIWRT